MSKLAKFAAGIVLMGGLLEAVPLAAAAAPGPAPKSVAAEAAADSEARLKELERRIRELEAQLAALRGAAGGEQADRIARLEEQIDALSREIEHLKIGEAAAPIAQEPVHGLGPAASKIYKVREGVSVGGYGELTYTDAAGRMDSGDPSGADDTLDLLRAVLYFGYKWNDRILFNSEIEFEHATTGEGDEEKGEVSVEFAYVDFLWKKALNARAGLLLLPMGILNEMHEPTTFHGVLRPRVETVILPSTWRENGAGVYGETDYLAYRAYLVAGLDALGFSADEGIREGRQGGSQSLANDFALTARLDLTRVPGLVAGVSAFSGAAAQGQLDARARTTVYDLHALYEKRGFQARGVWARGSIDDVEEIDQALTIAPGSTESVGEKQKGWYLEGAYDLLSVKDGARQSLSLFLRHEALDTQDGVPAGFLEDPSLDQRIWTAGITWKPIPQVALKADVQDVDDSAGTGVDGFHVGLGWIF
ncbi:MAG TPA: hypothetical protein VFW45_02975 [Candidatus Polarisedimenticolia bacterium]|nr:hypothetical protein [Candidatus Polarisedimenticolia bacterium]